MVVIIYILGSTSSIYGRNLVAQSSHETIQNTTSPEPGFVPMFVYSEKSRDSIKK